MARKNIVAGNWKMNKNLEEAVALAKALGEQTTRSKTEIVLGVPSVFIKSVRDVLKKKKYIKLAGQNCHQASKGAFTGETSVGMLASVGAEYVILGHSERRQFFAENDALIAQKINATLEGGLTPIFCCGEPLEIREANTHVAYVADQLKASLYHLDATQIAKIVIAYEPIWAIGTGKTASTEQAQAMHRDLRSALAKQYGRKVANGISILYGGSCNAKNAKELFAQPDVDGGLIGGASLVAEDFLTIINAF